VDKLVQTLGRHPVADAKGLFLKVKASGSALWTYRYRFEGRETETSLGTNPEIGLAEALGLHAQKVALVRNAVDPLAAKRSAPATAEPATAPTFGAVAAAYVESHKAGWKSPVHL
jgi:hypothetical protein